MPSTTNDCERYFGHTKPMQTKRRFHSVGGYSVVPQDADDSSDSQARCVIRTRLRTGVNTIPTWALEYLVDITMDDDSEWAWESAGAFGWAVGHAKIAVFDRTLRW